jgi:trehalose 6-phosphate phosphatase
MQDRPPTIVARPEQLLAAPARWAFFMDIDGTLLDMAPTPDAVMVPPGLIETCARLAEKFDGAVALSTGRRVSDADRLFRPLKLVTAGVHGTEVRRDAGGDIMMLVPPVPANIVQAINDLTLIAPAILVEQKGAGMAVHYRNAPDARDTLEAELRRIVRGYADFVVRPGRKVLEVIPNGYSKGTVLDWLMKREPFRGRCPIMIGDDYGDQSALLAAERHGGFGLKVAGEHFSRARSDFDGVADVRAWLETLADDAAQPPRAQLGVRVAG